MGFEISSTSAAWEPLGSKKAQTMGFEIGSEPLGRKRLRISCLSTTESRKGFEISCLGATGARQGLRTSSLGATGSQQGFRISSLEATGFRKRLRGLKKGLITSCLGTTEARNRLRTSRLGSTRPGCHVACESLEPPKKLKLVFEIRHLRLN